LLREKDIAGVRQLESLVPDNPTYRVPVYACLAEFYARTDSEQNEHWLARLEGAMKRRAAAVAGFTAKLERGRASPTTLSSDAQAVLSNAIAGDPCVVRAWLLQGSEPLATAETEHAADLDIHALVLTLDPEILAQTGQDEDTQLQRYAGALAALLAADAELVVRTYYTTQPLPAGLNGHSRLVDRRTAQMSS
jgi:hypothetical protein